jgi:hypothetical protein
MADDLFIWIRVRVRTLWAAINALREQTVSRHHEASQADNAEAAKELHAEGDQASSAAEELRTGYYEDKEPK